MAVAAGTRLAAASVFHRYATAPPAASSSTTSPASQPRRLRGGAGGVDGTGGGATAGGETGGGPGVGPMDPARGGRGGILVSRRLSARDDPRRWLSNSVTHAPFSHTPVSSLTYVSGSPGTGSGSRRRIDTAE
ncbi:hypothetical protein GCM10010168_92670 [Actinoplanes ianthinogenes]|uniref:Uncharacterized protein n=1 Tax=Actinoplanes ianthinogenes TaxID=122358 RepID=A0ABM7LJY1_9ACTN|nr:hypothetical protein Aiant_02110 [Actinoplanes ianthinogenes]GGR59168.1 hypothetical protein GCM10010168_92670 [Actinoplanes ianthinogenes]